MKMMMWEDEDTSCGATVGENPGPARRDTIKYPTHSVSGRGTRGRDGIRRHSADDRVSMYRQQFFGGSVLIASASAGYSSKIVIPLSDAADSQ